MGDTPKTIDDYLAGVPADMRPALERVRRIVRETLPEVIEGISYSMPAFYYRGKQVAGFAAFKDHCSYIPYSGSVVPKLPRELTGFTVTSGTVHFTSDNPLSSAVIARLVEVRKAEIDKALDKK